MRRILLVSVPTLLVAGCSGPSLRCGAGTHEAGGECVPITDAGIAGKRFFMTSSTYTADLKTAGGGADGLSGADTLCQRGADGANLGGTWKAFISSNNQAAIDRIDDVGPWFDLKGRKVFNNKVNLGTTPLTDLGVDENGAKHEDDSTNHRYVWVWTGSNVGGIPSGATCNDWTVSDRSGPTATCGRANTAAEWLSATAVQCDGYTGTKMFSLHLYCFEQ